RHCGCHCRCDRPDGAQAANRGAVAALRAAGCRSGVRAVRRGAGARARAGLAVPDALMLGAVSAQLRAARAGRTGGRLAARAVVFHAARPLCGQARSEKGGQTVKLLAKLLLPLALLVLCGCSDEVSPVSALALDKTANGYRLTAEIVRQDSLDDTASPAYLSASGQDLPELIQTLGNLLPGELYLSHAQ